MSGVDVCKNPSAEQIEGGIGGLVNLRTALPFDNQGSKGAVSGEAARSDLRGKVTPSYSALLSNRWVPAGGAWTTNNFDCDRKGLYGALQWKQGPLASSLTYFRSKYEMMTTENAFFQGANPATIKLDAGAIFDDKGALLTGTLRAPTEPGIGFGTDARTAGRTADTRDTSWNISWRVSGRWNVTADLQRVKATTHGYDNTVGLGGYTPKETLDLRGSPPLLAFDAADRASLVNLANYYWGFTQEHRDRAESKMDVARVDARFSFDNPVLDDLRFGVRMTEREAQTRSTYDQEWTMVSQPWAAGDSWQPMSSLAYLSHPRFAGNTNVLAFHNFMGGNVAMPPSVLVPDMSLTTNTDVNFTQTSSRCKRSRR